MYIPTGISEVI